MPAVPTPLLPALMLPALILTVFAPAGNAAFLPQNGTVAALSAAPAYATVAALAIKAPMVIDATIRGAARVKDAAGLPAGRVRMFVTADVGTLIRGPSGVAPRIGYLIDVRPDAAGRLPRLKKRRVLLFARPVAGMADQVVLVSSAAQLAWSPAADELVRRVAGEVARPDAPPAITGVGNAFFTAGTLPGEGETQIFLTAEGDRPVSLSVTRRQGQEPAWRVALGESVDAAVPPPPRDTLLWYRLACGLPAALPPESTQALGADDATRVRDDYAWVLASLGPCRSDASGGAGSA